MCVYKNQALMKKTAFSNNKKYVMRYISHRYSKYTEPAFTCSIETLEKVVKYVQS